MENKETLADQIAKFQEAVENFKKEVSKEVFMPIIEFIASKIRNNGK